MSESSKLTLIDNPQEKYLQKQIEMFENGDKDLLYQWNKNNKNIYTNASVILTLVHFTFFVFQWIRTTQLTEKLEENQ